MMVCHELKMSSVKFNPFECTKEREEGGSKITIGANTWMQGEKSPSKNKDKERNHKEDG